MESREPGKAEVAVAVAATVVSSLVMAWSMMPEQERLWIRLRIASALHRFAGRRAWREGRAGMADELAGRKPDARARYGSAYVLSRLRDAAARSLEGMRS
jgi:hypothetical protein